MGRTEGAMETLKIKSTNPETQGDFIIINAEDFDPSIHELFEQQEASAKKGKVNG